MNINLDIKKNLEIRELGPFTRGSIGASSMKFVRVVRHTYYAFAN